jgi:hypothetical protein
MQRDIARQEIIDILAERDGYECIIKCGKPFTDTDKPSLDHWRPVSWAKANGWTIEQINDISNLRLAHRSCNSRKGNMLPLDDYTLPPLPPKKEPGVKVVRPEICDTCYSGRLLFPGEVCYDCGSEAQPKAAPKATQKTPKECTHSGFDHCWMCYLDFVPRSSALTNLITGE